MGKPAARSAGIKPSRRWTVTWIAIARPGRTTRTIPLPLGAEVELDLPDTGWEQLPPAVTRVHRLVVGNPP